MSTDQIDVLVAVEDEAWAKALPEAEALALRAARTALDGALEDDLYELPAGAGELSLVLADDATVQALNREYRGKDKPTNVLSFALHADADGDMPTPGLAEGPPPPVLLGDVILAYETVMREAAEQSKPLEHHFTHLVIHGVLHLIGYDHIEEDDATEMETLETRLLNRLGIPDPYAGGASRAFPDDPGLAADPARPPYPPPN